MDTAKGGSKLYCEEHPGEKITNFCFTTLKSLCPSCIDPHNKMLRQNNVFPEVDTIRNVKSNCAKKVKAAIVALSGELMKLESQVVVNPREVIDSGVITMNKVRERVIAIVYKFFEDLEIEYTRKINDIMLKLNNNDETSEKIRNLTGELEHLLNNVESPSCIQTVKKILMIDSKTMLDKTRFEVNKTLEYRNYLANSFSDITFDENRLYGLPEILSKCIGVQHKEDRVQNQGDVSMIKGNVSDFDMQPSQGNAILKYHKTYFNDINVKFPVIAQDYFDSNCQTKYLHFFQNHENRLHFLDVEDLATTRNGPAPQSVELDISFSIPPFHKSIVTPKGDIFLVGGSDSDNSKRKLRTTYYFDFKRRTLLPKGNMNTARSSFAICYMNNHLYAVGGLTNNSVFTNACEKYDIVNDKWIPIASLNYDVLAPCVAAFNNKYLFKFGGNSLENRFETFVEKYDEESKQWTSVAFTLDKGLGTAAQYFRVLTTSACIQINPQEIYVFGGYLEDNTGSNQTFIFRVNDPANDDKNPSNYLITHIGLKTLTDAEAFWNNAPIIHGKHVYALQNVPTPDQEDICLDDRRRVVAFNGVDWKSLN
jgi:hypothetical protein